MHAACDYDACDWSGHSPPVAIALDGRIIFGMWESAGVMPTLDSCNGHYGNTPASVVEAAGSDETLDVPAMTNIYHYHFSGLVEPFTIGCFGPVNSVDECKA